MSTINLIGLLAVLLSNDILQFLSNHKAVKMLNFLKAENIFDVASCLHLYSRVWGLTAFGIEENEGRSWKAKLSLWNCIHVILLCVYLTMLGIHFILYQEEFFEFEGILLSKVIKIAMILSTSVYCFAVIAISSITLFTRNSIVDVINIIAQVDKELLHLGFRFNHRKHKRFLILTIFFWFFVTLGSSVTFYFYSSLFNLKINFFLYYSLIMCVHFIFAFHFQFVLMIWCIKTRFRELNHFLFENFTTSSVKIYRDDNKKLKNLNLAARLHEMLVMASECFNEGFGAAVSQF